jgi:hypothetical protein
MSLPSALQPILTDVQRVRGAGALEHRDGFPVVRRRTQVADGQLSALSAWSLYP